MLKWISHLSFSLLTYIRVIGEYIRVLHHFLTKYLILLIIRFLLKKIMHFNIFLSFIKPGVLYFEHSEARSAEAVYSVRRIEAT